MLDQSNIATSLVQNKVVSDEIPYFDYYSGGNILTEYTKTPSDLFLKDNLFSLRYANYPRDLFMGVLPSSQLGSVATVNVISNTILRSNLSSFSGNLTGTVASNGTDIAVKNSVAITASANPPIVQNGNNRNKSSGKQPGEEYLHSNSTWHKD